jgi:hypothetical protein
VGERGWARGGPAETAHGEGGRGRLGRRGAHAGRGKGGGGWAANWAGAKGKGWLGQKREKGGEKKKRLFFF